MQQTPETIFRNFKKNNHRLTIVRKAMVEFFCTNVNPCKAQDLIKKLKKGLPSLNKSTVYRELDFLEKQGIIQKTYLFEGSVQYQLVTNCHRHHISCLECKEVSDLQLDESICNLDQRISQHNGFKILSHSVEFFGICEKCQAKPKGN